MEPLETATALFFATSAQIIPTLWIGAFLTGGEAGRRVSFASFGPLALSAWGLWNAMLTLARDASGGVRQADLNYAFVWTAVGVAAATLALFMLSTAHLIRIQTPAQRKKLEQDAARLETERIRHLAEAIGAQIGPTRKSDASTDVMLIVAALQLRDNAQQAHQAQLVQRLTDRSAEQQLVTELRKLNEQLNRDHQERTATPGRERLDGQTAWRRLIKAFRSWPNVG